MVLFILLALTVPVSTANSGPVYMEGYPSFNITALEDCPIIVVSETLEFDFSTTAERMSWSPSAHVTASYRLHNPTREQETVTMAFPSVMSLFEIESFTKITADGQTIPFTMLLADNVSHMNFNERHDRFRQTASMENILGQLNSKPFEPRNFDKDGTAALYRFSISEPYERLNLIVSFSLDPERTKIVLSDFNGYSVFSDGRIELSTWFESGIRYRAEPWMLVLGEDTIRDLRIETYENYKANPIRDAGATYEKENVETDHFLSEQISRQIAQYELDMLEIDDYISPIYRRLDEMFEYNQIATLMDAIGVIHEPHLVVFLYEVTFPPGSMTEVIVQYMMDGTMDRRDRRNPMYTYAYISNPARGFADFGNIDAVIRPPTEAPFLLSSTWPFERDDDGIYTASFDALPDDDLLFTLYTAPEVPGRLPYVIGGIIGILLLAGATIFMIQKFKHKNTKEMKTMGVPE